MLRENGDICTFALLAIAGMAITPTGKNASGAGMLDVLQRILDGVERTEEAPRGLVAEFARVRALREPSN